VADRIDRGSAIRAAGGGGVLLRKPYEKQAVLVELPPEPPDDPVSLPGLNDLPASVVRPMDTAEWAQSRHRRAAEFAERHTDIRGIKPPNPFGPVPGYTPPVTVAAADFENTVLDLMVGELLGELQGVENGNAHLDAQIHRAIGRKFGYRDALPAYTSDPNAAAQVDPQGVTHEIRPGVVILRTRGADPPVEYIGRHDHPAIARCLAALKARMNR
jgi:hypothetical protein